MKEKLTKAGIAALKAGLIAFFGAIAGGAVAPDYVQQIVGLLMSFIGG